MTEPDIMWSVSLPEREIEFSTYSTPSGIVMSNWKPLNVSMLFILTGTEIFVKISPEPSPIWISLTEYISAETVSSWRPRVSSVSLVLKRVWSSTDWLTDVSKFKVIDLEFPAGIIIGKSSEIDKGETKLCDKISKDSVPSFRIWICRLSLLCIGTWPKSIFVVINLNSGPKIVTTPLFCEAEICELFWSDKTTFSENTE